MIHDKYQALPIIESIIHPQTYSSTLCDWHAQSVVYLETYHSIDSNIPYFVFLHYISLLAFTLH